MGYPAHPDIMTMSLPMQHQFTIMQYPPVLITAAFALWVAYRHRSTVPLLLYAGGAITYIAEPIMNVLGLVWYPPIGLNTVWESLGRPVPLFGLLAYLWFQGGVTVVVYDRLRKGITTRGLWMLYAGLVVLEALLEIPGLNTNSYFYYGNQPFVLFKFPLYWGFCNAAAPMAAGAIAYRVLPSLAAPLRIVALYVSCVGNALVMGGAGLPTFFALNTDAPLAITTIAGTVTILTACLFVHMVTLVGASDARGLRGDAATV